jgi:hypothetical protein
MLQATADLDYGAGHRGCSSVVERQLPKLNVVGSIPITRSNNFNDLERTLICEPPFLARN